MAGGSTAKGTSALYTALTPEGAIAEANQAGRPFEPVTLVAYEADLGPVLDACDCGRAGRARALIRRFCRPMTGGCGCARDGASAGQQLAQRLIARGLGGDDRAIFRARRETGRAQSGAVALGQGVDGDRQRRASGLTRRTQRGRKGFPRGPFIQCLAEVLHPAARRDYMPSAALTCAMVSADQRRIGLGSRRPRFSAWL